MDNSLSRLIKPLLRKDNHGKKKKTDMLVVWIVIIAVVFLLIGNLFEKDDRREKGKNISQESVNYSEEMYIKNMEERLTGVLKKINGTGNISLFMYLVSGGLTTVVNWVCYIAIDKLVQVDMTVNLFGKHSNRTDNEKGTGRRRWRKKQFYGGGGKNCFVRHRWR